MKSLEGLQGSLLGDGKSRRTSLPIEKGQATLLDRLLLSPTNRCRSLRCSLYVSAKLSRVPTSPVSTDEARQSPKNSHFDGPFTVCGIRRVQKWFCLLEVTENWKCNDLYTSDPQMNQFFIPQQTITTKLDATVFQKKKLLPLNPPNG
jgi:hypothetical protein